MKGIKYLLLALIIASLCFSCATTEMRSIKTVKNKQVQNKMNGQGEVEKKADENEWQK